MARSKLLAALAARLGPAQASNELRWLQNHASSTDQLAALVHRRLADEPLQYILGSQPFGPLNLLARPPVLIPRPETEHWVINLAQRLQSPGPKSLLDLGTGSGCIPLLLCHLLPQGSLRAHGVDISTHALQLALDNATRCAIPPRSTTKNTFITSLADFLSPAFPVHPNLSPPYDIITSNPPYIPSADYPTLPRSVTAYEDPKALFAGPTGLDFYHAIAQLIRRKGFLRPGATVALEVGHDQADAVERIMRVDAAMCHTEIWLDPWGKQRTVLARSPLWHP